MFTCQTAYVPGVEGMGAILFTGLIVRKSKARLFTLISITKTTTVNLVCLITAKICYFQYKTTHLVLRTSERSVLLHLTHRRVRAILRDFSPVEAKAASAAVRDRVRITLV